MTDGIHGFIHWKNVDRDTPLSYARHVNGVERRAEWIELDGVDYYPADFELLEVFEDGKRVAIELDGVRFVPERTCELISDPPDVSAEQGEELYPCYLSECGACGAYLWDVNEFNYCPSCGAKVVSE